MAANLTPAYRKAEERYREARTAEEKIDALQEMLREIPKHKGTSHMQADLKSKIAQAKKDAGKKSATARQTYEYHYPREGAGQVVLIGPPNSGKSTLMARLSNAEVVIADYPYSTRKPQPCMVPYQDVQIQVIDTPPVSRDFFETWLAGIVRNADLVVLLLDLASDDLLDDFEVVLTRLEAHKLRFLRDPGERYTPDGLALKRTLLAGNKSDDPRAAGNLGLLTEMIGERFEIITLSAATGEGVDAWVAGLYRALGVVRVYSKQPGKPADTDPVLLPRGATLEDFARTIHKEFAEKLKYAKVWGAGKFDGQMVNRDFELSEGDIIELHA
jgi:ribosome-interacting GTPase 1